MKNNNGLSLLPSKRKWQLIPFLVMGILIFNQTSTLELNYFAKGYLLIMEIQVAFVVLYWLIFSKNKRDRS
jgi:hypothetical protein